jgi:hypothetical protein
VELTTAAVDKMKAAKAAKIGFVVILLTIPSTIKITKRTKDKATNNTCRLIVQQPQPEGC